MRRLALLALFAILPVLVPLTGRAQALEDALRLATSPVPSGSRGLGMDGSLISSADGYSALDYNPAALAPLGSRDIGITIFDRAHGSTATFIGNPLDASVTTTLVGSFGIAAPVPTERGHLAFGVSYDRAHDYSSTYSFKAVNASSSFLNTQGFIDDPHNGLMGQDLRDYLDQNNLAWQLHLTRDVPDSAVGSLRTIPFSGGLEQSGTVTESGGPNALRLGAGIDIAPSVAVGATLNVFFGTYDYARSYTEKDVNNIYASQQNQLPPLSFQNAMIVDAIHEDQTGANIKLGLLAYGSDVVKFGLTFETPTIIRISEAFQRTGKATFGSTDTISGSQGSYEVTGANAGVTTNNYTIITPLKAGVGISGHLIGATLEGDLTYQDMRQLRFTDGDVDLSDLNLEAQQVLRSVIDWHLGAEYVFSPIGLSVRAGYGVEKSAYKGDPATFDTKSYSFGAGLLLSKSILLEAGYRHASYHTTHSIYNDLTVEGQAASANIDDDLVNRNDISLSFNYRF